MRASPPLAAPPADWFASPAPTGVHTAEDLLQIEYDLALRLGAVRDFSEALSAILDAALRVPGIDSGGIYLVDPETSDLVLSAHRGLSAEFVAAAARYPASAPHATIVRGGAPLFSTYLDIEVQRGSAQLSEGLRALGVIPVRHEESTLAVLNVASHTEGDIPAVARTALVSIASRIGAVLDRVRSEQEARAAEHGFQALFDSLRDFLFVLDGDGRIVHTNSVAQERLGYTADELRGRPVTDVHPEEMRSEAVRIVGEMLSGRTTYCPLALETRSGERIPVETVVSRGRFRGKDAIIGVSRDITLRMRAEAALTSLNSELERRVAERTAELELASRTKDDFLASMSHELRTPLNAVLAIAEALQERVYGELGERQHTALRRLEESGRHLLDLITDILDISKVDAGAMKLDIEPVVVADAARAALRMVQEGATRKHHVLALRVESEIHTIEADRRRLKQILVNLLTNAVKFTPPGGAIALEVTSVDGAVRFTVHDSGVGISPEDLPKLFQRFVQLDASLSRPQGGTGLGLSLVHRFTSLHGGRVEVASQRGAGSHFTVTLPLAPTPMG